MESFIQAKLTNYKKLKVLIFTNIKRFEPYVFLLYKDNEKFDKLTVTKQSFQNNIHYFELSMSKEIGFGHEYSLLASDFSLIPVDVSEAVYFDDFDEKFFYDGDDLGSNYSKGKTDFALWAPLASSVMLKLENGSKFEYFKMNRTENGVYRISIPGDLKDKKYHYLVTNSGVCRETNDPYAKGTSLNSEYSVVLDLNELNQIKNVAPTNKIKNYVDSVIYETNVRDFTENCKNSKKSGKFLGFIEENAKTKAGNPAGIDYLKFLGISHVQIQPVLDFAGVDDLNPGKSYNWGYDPISYFAIEGSYSVNPENPISRLLELKTMISKLHENNIRVILDVVYNHVFDYSSSTLEACVPNYYFRRTKNGLIANASGCGNDLDTKRKMVSKLIVDSITYLLKTFDFDGFRFDLMGLIDIDTVNNCVLECKKIKNDIMIYGEGWDMGNELAKEEKSNIENHEKLPFVAFFNDTYRNIMLGSIAKNSLDVKGFGNGNPDYIYGFDYIFNGSCIKKSYDPMFDNANQSINYVECHDNYTLYDKLLVSNANEDEETILKRITFINKSLLMSFGVPFIHSGQEIGQSKEGHGNTYNLTKINAFNYDLLDERFEMAAHFKAFVALRRKLSYLSLYNPEDINNCFETEFWNNKMYCLKAKNSNFIRPYQNLLILVNNENFNKCFELDDYYVLIQGAKPINEIIVKNNFAPSCSVGVFTKKEGK